MRWVVGLAATSLLLTAAASACAEQVVEAWRTPFGQARAVAANSSDGSCWLAIGSSVMHLGANGTVLSQTNDVKTPSDWYTRDPASWISVNPTDGSCWVADRSSGQVVHLTIVLSFSDVPYDHWARLSVEACAAAGIVEGYPDGTYHPEEEVSRGHIAVYIARALAGGDANVPTGPATATFPDVPTDHWAYKYVEYCHDQSVVQGYWDGYRPDEAVNRAQMAVFVAPAMVAPSGDAAIPNPEPPPTFPDVPATYWAWKWIEYCHGQGVVQGYWDGYHPEEVVNRAQMAVYVQRAFELPL